MKFEPSATQRIFKGSLIGSKCREQDSCRKLVCSSGHKEGVEFDNLGKTLLDPKLFNETRKTVQRPFVEVNAMTTEDTLNPH